MDQISQIKQKLNVVDVVGGYVSLKKAGRNYRGLCPFHSEKTPSFMVSQELQIYKCFGCGAAGDIFDFVEHIEGVDFPAALEQLAERAGVKLEKSDLDPQGGLKKQIFFINELTTRFYQYLLLKHKIGKQALSYLTKDRKLSPGTIKEFSLGYAPDNWDSLYSFLSKKSIKAEDMLAAGVIVQKQSGNGFVDKFRGRVMFPLMGVDGKVIGYTARTLLNREPKYLNTSETPVFHKTFFLFGLDKNKLNIKKEGVIFVEGQMDLISAYQAGIRNVVSVSGTSLTDNQLTLLARYTNDITFCFDADTAGIGASYRAIEMAEKRNFNIKIAVIPPPHKDIDDLIKSNVTEAKRILKESFPVYDFYIMTALKKYDKTSAMGKKSIMDELIPLFSKISNQVLLDHYTKRIASELEMLEDSVTMILKKGKIEEKDTGSFDPAVNVIAYKKNPEGYLLALLFKSGIDIAKNFAYKVSLEYFQNEDLKTILENLQKFLKDKKKTFNVDVFIKKLDEGKRETASELYLWDLESVTDTESTDKIAKELDVTVKRIKNEFTRKSLKSLSDEIKMAEMAKETAKVEKLTKKFERLSKGLL